MSNFESVSKINTYPSIYSSKLGPPSSLNHLLSFVELAADLHFSLHKETSQITAAHPSFTNSSPCLQAVSIFNFIHPEGGLHQTRTICCTWDACLWTSSIAFLRSARIFNAIAFTPNADIVILSQIHLFRLNHKLQLNRPNKTHCSLVPVQKTRLKIFMAVSLCVT